MFHSNLYDSKDSKLISTEKLTYEFCDVMRQEKPPSTSELLKAFKKMDINNDGYITHNELSRVLTQVRGHMSFFQKVLFSSITVMQCFCQFVSWAWHLCPFSPLFLIFFFSGVTLQPLHGVGCISRCGLHFSDLGFRPKSTPIGGTLSP